MDNLPSPPRDRSPYTAGERVPDRPDKLSRKDKLHQWRAQQRAAARAKLPLADQQMQAMFDMLDSELPKRGCDYTLRLVREWAEESSSTQGGGR